MWLKYNFVPLYNEWDEGNCSCQARGRWKQAHVLSNISIGFNKYPVKREIPMYFGYVQCVVNPWWWSNDKQTIESLQRYIAKLRMTLLSVPMMFAHTHLLHACFGWRCCCCISRSWFDSATRRDATQRDAMPWKHVHNTLVLSLHFICTPCPLLRAYL